MAEQIGVRAAQLRALFPAWSDHLPRAVRVGLIALLVAGAYFLTARLAFVFAYPNTRVLLLWPPCVVLIVAMLFTPRRTWWTFILAALPVHLFAITPAAAPSPIALLFYAGNVIESVIIVLFIQRFNGDRPRFDRFHSTLEFIALAVFTPAIGSFFVALAAQLLHVPPGFIGIWQSRYLSYVVTMLVLLPPALVLMETRGALLRKLPPRRWAEAGLMALCFLGVGLFIQMAWLPQLQSQPGLLVLPLLLLMWAALSFGVAGVSMGLLFTALLSLWSASWDIGPFNASTDAVLGLKVLLIELGVPLMLMAALLGERRKTVDSLQARNRQVHQLAGQLITAQEEERRRVARELHDQIGQSLTAVKINLETLRQAGADAGDSTLLDEGIHLADQSLAQVRDLSVLLRPSMLDDLGLEPALRALLHSQSKRAGHAVTLHVEGLQCRPPRTIETVCYRVAQEGLTNIARHAHAKNVSLRVVVQDGRLRMMLCDDGVGFDEDAMRARVAAGTSMGMTNMTERAALAGGTLHIASAPRRGTTLTLDVPLTPSA